LLRPDLPAAFQPWFEKALARTPEARFQTARELADGLGVALAGASLPVMGMNSSPDPLELRPDTPRFDSPPSSRRIAMPVGAMAAPAAAVVGGDRLEGSQAAGDRMDGRAVALGGIGGSTVPAGGRVGMTSPAPAAVPGVAYGGGGPTPSGAASGVETVRLGGSDPSRGSPPTATLDERFSHHDAHRRGGRAILTLLGVFGVIAAGYAAWWFLIRPTAPPLATAVTPLASASAMASAAPEAPAPKGPKWAPLVASAQAQIATSNLPDAVRLLKEASEGVPANHPTRLLLEQAQVASSTKGPCKVTAISRPRPWGIGAPAGRPTIAFTPRGALVAWSDDHESAGHDHAYLVLLDSAMRSSGPARDVTPESGQILRTHLFAFGDHVGLIYTDGKGPEAGLHARWLDAEGRIAGPPRRLSSRKAVSGMNPTVARATDGTFWVAWDDDRQPDSSDLYLRHLSAELEPIGAEVRATDYVGRGARPRVRVPSIAVAGGYLNAVFRFERETTRLIDLLRVGLLDPTLTSGLEPNTRGTPRDRELGEVKLVNQDKDKADTPHIECVTDGCYLTWSGEGGGAHAAYMEGSKGEILWRKKFDPKGVHPTLAVAPSGAVELAWFEGGRLKIAPVTRDGVGLPTAVARATGDPPPPSLAAGGAPGEWYVTWLDAEAGHSEPFGTRALCK
jgi:serine/threonine-protein kinase